MTFHDYLKEAYARGMTHVEAVDYAEARMEEDDFRRALAAQDDDFDPCPSYP